jgi:hypothetical protein
MDELEGITGYVLPGFVWAGVSRLDRHWYHRGWEGNPSFAQQAGNIARRV